MVCRRRTPPPPLKIDQNAAADSIYVGVGVWFHISTGEEMVNFFYSTILQLLDFYTPLTRKSTRVTTEFKHLVKQRQRAFLGSQTEHYRKLRNKVQRMAATLRKRFYTRKIESLHSANPHFWWRWTKQFLHLKHSDGDPLHIA